MRQPWQGFCFNEDKTPITTSNLQRFICRMLSASKHIPKDLQGLKKKKKNLQSFSSANY